MDLLDKMKDAFKRNPVIYLTLGVAVLMVLRSVALEGEPLAEVLKEDALLGVLLAAYALVTRFMVYAKPNAEREISRSRSRGRAEGLDLAVQHAKYVSPQEAKDAITDVPSPDVWEDEGGGPR